MLTHMREATLKPDPWLVICNAGISACEKGEQWQQALALLSEMWEAELQPTIIFLQRRGQRVRERQAVAVGPRAARRDAGGEGGARRHHQPERWDQRVREVRAVGAGPVAAPRGAGGGPGARRRELQRRDQRVREGRAVAVGPGAAQRYARGEAGAQLGTFTYSASVSACAKSEQWQRTLALLGEAREAKLEPNAVLVLYNAGISACEKGGQWQLAMSLLSEMMSNVKLEPNVISYSAGVSSCEKGKEWQQALSLLSGMQEANVEPNGISCNAGISACEKGEQWQQALAVLCEFLAASVEIDVTYLFYCQRQRVLEGRSLQLLILGLASPSSTLGRSKTARVGPNMPRMRGSSPTL
ncbi:unnamed protein product [Prorocentrum cordatum]|uniref:Pentatricopeptide repeat-containing protein, chloroplastic n=1 Tax=Prorocentrum cordatum TaxID=2364126 RepID=A0ABN9XJ95_9DINO|nr:unnamed protein product [Polarella glacialis]